MYTESQLFTFSRKIFLAMECSDEDASQAAETLISADLRGVDSHGVARLSGYVRLWEDGRINAQPKTKIIHETPSTALLDGDAGLGLVIAPKAMNIAIRKAQEVGSGWIAIRNTNHLGIAGYHAMKALEFQMIGITTTNASPLVAPTHSKERLLGTNPIAFAVPAGEEPPFVADFATTTAANGKVEILERKGEEAPLGWIQDETGNPTTDPSRLRTGGALLPLGSDRQHGSHKGYCLGAMVDILSGVLSGANYGPWVPPFVSYIPLAGDAVGDGIGHFVGALRIDAFRPSSEFKSHMDNWIRRFRNSTPASKEHPVLIPGDPEREMEKVRKLEGIPLIDRVVQDLTELSGKFNIPL